MNKFRGATCLVDDDENEIKSWMGREGSGLFRLLTKKRISNISYEYMRGRRLREMSLDL